MNLDPITFIEGITPYPTKLLVVNVAYKASNLD